MNINTLEDAKRFWDAYESNREAAMFRDRVANSFGIFSGANYKAFEKEFWQETYTHEIDSQLRALGQHYGGE